MNLSSILKCTSVVGLCCAGYAAGQSPRYTNILRQIQFPGDGTGGHDLYPDKSGEQLSLEPIPSGGTRFELWTIDSIGPKSYLLASQFVGSYIPVASVRYESADPYPTIPRTRADQPIKVIITVNGLLDASNPNATESAKSVKLLRHVQSYGAGGTGVEINRDQAILQSQSFITKNGDLALTYAITSIPGPDRAKIRGEERFSVYSLKDYQVPEAQIASQFIQVWPVADGTITGISQGQLVEFEFPPLTITLNDLYPDSTTYVQAYPGNPQLGVSGKVIPGSAVVINDTVPNNRVLTVNNYDSVFDQDGRWTIELLTVTPFGIDRLANVTFDVDRTIDMVGNISTVK